MKEQQTNWTIEVEGITLSCNYWPIEANETRIGVNIPLAAPDKVNGANCHNYVDGIKQDQKYWKEYTGPEHGCPEEYYTEKGGQQHGPTVSFGVDWDGERVWGGPSNSPFTLSDPNLNRLCCWEESSLHKENPAVYKSSHFLRLKPEVARAIRDSLFAQIENTADLKTRALMESWRVPEGMNREDHLPFVEACLLWLDDEQNAALDADSTARSFSLFGQQIEYQRDYERLTGRKWEGGR